MALTRPKASQINTVITNVTDPLIVLNNGSTTANIDVGIVMNRNNGTNPNVAVFWDESANSFVTSFTSSSGDTNANIVISEYANIKAGTLFGNIGGGSVLSNVYITGSLIPTANVTYDLGTPTQKFRSAYFSGNTVYIGSESMSVNSDGTWNFSSNGSSVSFGSSSDLTSPSANISGNLITGGIKTDNYYYANGSPVSFGGGTSTANTISNGFSNIVITSGNVIFANVPVLGRAIEINNMSYGNSWPGVSNSVGILNRNFVFNGQSMVVDNGLRIEPNSINTATGTLTLAAIGNQIRIQPNGAGGGTVNIQAATTFTSTTNTFGNATVGGILTDNYYYANGTPVSFGGSYGNTEVSQYLPTYTGNISANIGAFNQINLTNSTVYLGTSAGTGSTPSGGIGIGIFAGQYDQGTYGIAIGGSAQTYGNPVIGDYAIAIGNYAGYMSQGNSAIALGRSAGQNYQEDFAIAVGDTAGLTGQIKYSIAIGTGAGYENLGANSVVIGTNAGYMNTPANTIVINANGANLSPTTSGFFVNPITQDSSPGNILYYNTTTKEISYGTISSSSISSGLSNVSIASANANVNISTSSGILTFNGTALSFATQSSSNGFRAGKYTVVDGFGTIGEFTTGSGYVGIYNRPSSGLNGYLEIQGSTGQMFIRGNANIQVTTTSNGNIFMSPDGSGIVRITSNLATSGILTNNYYYANGTPISFDSYGNTQVAQYLPTYTGNIGGNVTVGGSLTVSGNLNVRGNTLYFDTNNLTVSDSIVELHYHGGNVYSGDDGRDIGLRFHYYKSGSNDNAFLGWENSTGYLEWYGTGVTESNSATITGNYGTFKTGNLQLTNSANITGNLNISGNLLAGGIKGTDGQLLQATDTGLAWITLGTSNNINDEDDTLITAVGEFVNVVVNNSNVGQFTSDKLTISGNVQADYFIGDGSLLTNLPGGSVSSISNGTSNVAVLVSGGCVTVTSGGNIQANLGFDNQWFRGTITATSNVSASWGVFDNLSLNSAGGPTLKFSAANGNIVAKTDQSIRFGTYTIDIYTVNNANLTINTGTGSMVVGNILPNSHNTSNIGASGTAFNTVFAKATSAQYADLAEIYTSDAPYEPGTVVSFGGDFEVTISITSHDPAVAGVVSTNPAYLMNDSVKGIPIALQGRVPCRVQGPISRGDRVVTSSTPGVAQKMAMAHYQPGCIIGKALESIDSFETKTIEVVVGRN